MHYRIRRNYLIYKTSFWWICFCLFLFYCLPSFIHTRPSVTCYCRTYCLCVLSYTDICRCALCIFQHELHIYIHIPYCINYYVFFYSFHFHLLFKSFVIVYEFYHYNIGLFIMGTQEDSLCYVCPHNLYAM